MNVRRSLKTLTLFAALALPACGEPTLAIENPLAVINVAPHDGAAAIDRAVKPTACFSEQVDAASAGAQLFLTDAQGARLDGQSLQQASPECISIVPAAQLDAESSYSVSIAKGLTSAAGRKFAADVSSRFTTAR